MLALLLLLLSYLSFTLSLNQEGLYLQRVKVSLSDPGGVLADWNSRDDTPCNWTGVKCSPVTGFVVSVNLDGAGLGGPFPTFLCRLSSLSTLNLHNNSINSSLPLSISSCRNLTALSLGQNLLEGPIPYTLTDIPNLRDLILEGNSFSGEIPARFGRFRRLETLDLVNNLLNGTIPAVLGNISTLKALKVGFNPFKPGRIAPELGNLSNLVELYLAHCNLFGSIPVSFGRLSRLTHLDVSNNLLTGPIPSLVGLKSAVQIELFNNSLSGELPAGWSNLTALRRFDASDNRLVGTIPDELCGLPLESLNLYDNQLVGLVPESIARSPYLREFKLFNNRLQGPLPSELGKHSRLETIDVSDNQFSGEIPAGVCDRGVLLELLMKNNSFSGTIPAVLGNCRTLIRVRLRANGISGEVPEAFWSLPHLDLLDLGENLFSGIISHTISGAWNLSVLFISKNGFSGNIPKEIGYVPKLVEFSGSDNKLSGKIPATIVNLGQLGRLDLHNNELSGEIPVGIQSLKQLNDLNLANNRLSGEIPDEIGSFAVLNYLDLSRNLFSGKIPFGLQNLKLNVLNLSYNRLWGDIPPLYAKDMYRESFLGNPGLCGDLRGVCGGKNGARNRRYVWIYRAIFVLVGMVSGFGAVWLGWKFWNFRKMKKGIFNLKWKSFHKLGFSEDEILDCLREDNVIGMGASGKVYRAVLGNGEVVAVKKLFERSRKDDGGSFDDVDYEKDAFEVEVETLGKIRHKNIVRLWCCCNTRDCKLLVYEYMPNGSLGDLLHSSKGDSLDWPTRLKIALDAAEGLSYLHHDSVPPIVHRDVKSNNILLDANFGARISDFGVAKIVRTVNKGAESMSVIAGSCGYIAPEYAYTLRVNEKSDVYSFGVVILELVTGRKPIDPELGEDLVTWVCNSLDKEGVNRVIDTHLDLVFKEQICKVLDIGILCVSPLPINRPSMPRVVKMLLEAGSADNKPRRGKKDCNLSPYYYQDYSDQV